MRVLEGNKNIKERNANKITVGVNLDCTCIKI